MDSILQQTYASFRFLIVDDASTDGTSDLIRSYDDSRIELVCLEQNIGQTGALNVGLERATTEWIARMDADDYSAPTRLEEQVRAMEANSGISCLGTFAWTFRDDPQIVDSVMTKQLKHADIKHELLSGSPMIHGSIMVNRKAMLEVGAYKAQYRYSADVELYDRMMTKHRVENIPAKLLGIRRHDQQGSLTTRSFDEIIEIFSNRLSTNNYSTADTGIIRKSLSRYHFIRARLLVGEKKPSQVIRELWRSMRFSPKTFFLVGPTILVGHQLSEQSRARIRRLRNRLMKREN